MPKGPDGHLPIRSATPSDHGRQRASFGLRVAALKAAGALGSLRVFFFDHTQSRVWLKSAGSQRLCAMQDKGSVTEFYRRAMEIRRIAEGIFDKTERQTLLKFVSDSEMLAARGGKKPA